MKERLGFVSNSSSSSFVAVGVYRDFTDDEKKRALESFGYSKETIDSLNDLNECFREKMSENYMVSCEPYAIGISIGRCSDDYLESFEVDFEELFHIAKEFSERFGIPINEVKLIGGTEDC